MSTAIQNDPKQRTAEQQLADATKRTAEVDAPIAQAPDPANDPTKESDEERAERIEREANAMAQQYLQEATELNAFLKLALFLISFLFGMLLIFGIGAIIFYALDFAMSLFDFDFSEISFYIILSLSFMNMIMSFCGCFGTWKLSGIDEENKRKLQWVNDEYDKVLKEIGLLNKTLERDLMRFEVEITHIENENKELRQSVDKIELQSNDFDNVRGKSKETFVVLMRIWNLMKILDAYNMINNVLRVEAAYYPKAYSNDNAEHGLNEREYNMLIRTSVRPNKVKKYFQRQIPFQHKIWSQRKLDGVVNGLEDVPKDNILMNELENALLLIYKKVFYAELKIEFPRQNNLGRQDSITLAEGLLNQGQPTQNNKAFNQNFDHNEFNEHFASNSF